MRFHADLHVHSKYSRATSRDLDLEHLAWWAGRKGIALVGTGDFTHPAWRAEIGAKLVPAEPGLFRLRDDIEREVQRTLPAACQSAARFMLTVEISTIYKKGDRTRKVHHLIYAPDFATVDRITARLARIGNIASDGRPILGLDSRDLLEIAIESSPDAYLVPAHIWTPWFAALGSQSGFDSIAECYGDLADRIFAVETGLSSDPPMNWRLSQLDRFRLVSNSDAHSPGKLGREATTFETDLDYFAVRHALETGEGYAGTVEFFPEEGKYHLDGHRRCGVRLEPHESQAHGNRCPACGQPATIGVLHRVDTLADRAEADVTPPPTAGGVSNLVPLHEVLSELLAVGPSSKVVGRSYDRLLAELGSELSILGAVAVDDIARASSSLVAEAVTRLRAGQVIREAGYDGEYGTIRLFDPSELRGLTSGASLFAAPAAPRPAPHEAPPAAGRAANTAAPSSAPTLTAQHAGRAANAARPEASGQPHASAGILAALDSDQRRAAETVAGPLAIVAGPGSGKTRTLAHRLAWLIAGHGAPASACLAITFTRRAAAEMTDRLARLLPDAASHVAVHTFHSLGLAILREEATALGLPPDVRVADEAERAAMLVETTACTPQRAEGLLRAISKAKRTQRDVPAALAGTLAAYEAALKTRHLFDFDDLVRLAVRALAADPAVASRYRDRFRWISVDEFQDVDDEQYRLLTLLAPPGGHLCVVGDPQQAIYGFRGADATCFARFAHDYPGAATIHLTRNYRSTGTIVAAASQVVTGAGVAQPIAEAVRSMHERIALHAAASDREEASFVVETIERLIGGHSLLSVDSGRAGEMGRDALGFPDFAVLYRTGAQTDVLCDAFARSGIPFARHSHDRLAAQPAVRAILDEWERGSAAGPDGIALAAQLRAAADRVAQRPGAPDEVSIALALQRLVALAGGGDGDRTRFADAVALATDADFRDPRAQCVSLLTLHAAKGLEFPIVFIVGLEDGVLPLHWGELDEATAAEERRLLYVGMTRARDRLFLSHAAQRMRHGQVRPAQVSPFLLDIEQALVDQARTAARPRRAGDRQMRLL